METLHQSDNIHNSLTHTKSTGWQPDGTYNKKPLDPNYFRNHYQKKTQNPLHLPQLRMDNIKQIQPIKASPNEQVHEPERQVLNKSEKSW